ncbi:hypothetical protein NLX62_03445, partial [Mycobacteriaceae bacterium Msp059]|nr:hypothetical protein [Mycobacteriaceae bacterium Msp059]
MQSTYNFTNCQAPEGITQKRPATVRRGAATPTRTQSDQYDRSGLTATAVLLISIVTWLQHPPIRQH